MHVVVCWSHFSGYMAACWRALAKTPGASVFVIAFEPDTANPFDAGLLDGVPHRLLKKHERHDAAVVRRLVEEQEPDRLMIGAWNNPAYRALAADAAVRAVPKILAIDTNFRHDWRQAVGRRMLRSYLRRFEAVAVPGERAAAYAQYLGFGGSRIRRGLYGIDTAVFIGCAERRAAGGAWPRRFLYAGRYAAEKAIDTLVAGYRQYRATVESPWELVCCGVGPEGHRLTGPGVTDLDFVPPNGQAAVFASAGAFVMPSRYEPWGVVIAEAAAAGLPLICSTACGAAVEVLREHYNGHAFTPDDAGDLARRMMAIHARTDLADWGRRSQALAAPYAAEGWPVRMFDGSP